MSWMKNNISAGQSLGEKRLIEKFSQSLKVMIYQSQMNNTYFIITSYIIRTRFIHIFIITVECDLLFTPLTVFNFSHAL
jgi:hypothetical protein